MVSGHEGPKNVRLAGVRGAPTHLSPGGGGYVRGTAYLSTVGTLVYGILFFAASITGEKRHECNERILLSTVMADPKGFLSEHNLSSGQNIEIENEVLYHCFRCRHWLCLRLLWIFVSKLVSGDFSNCANCENE